MLNHLLYNGLSMIPDTPGYLERPDLDALFKKAIQKPVITVIAGAGYGKTQAVSALLQNNQAHSLWLQLSALDNIVTRLWERFIYTISFINKDLSAALALLGFPDNTASFSKFLELITESMNSSDRYFFVLDDLHLINDKDIIQFVERFINARIVNISLILISRKELSINIVELSAKNLLFSITEDQLRFKKNELADYFEMHGINLLEQAISEIYDYTDGWIFAIYLIGLSLKKDITYRKVPLSSIKLDIFKLIESEIFSSLSKELQELLVKLSLFENLYLGLITELTSDNPMIIDEMMKIGSFITYDAYCDSYRIHHLFLDYLHGKQAQLKKSDIMKVYIKAAKWYANNGYIIDALIYYEKANCYHKIIDIVLGYSSFCANATAEFIIILLERIPKALYEEKPIIAVLKAKFLFNVLRIEDASEKLSIIRNQYEALPPTKENKAILGEVYIILGFISFITSFTDRKFEFMQLFKMADEYLPDGSMIIDRNVHFNRGTYACMVNRIHSESGSFEKLQEAMSFTMPYASRVMNGCGHGIEYLTMTETAFYKRDLKNAEKYAHLAIFKSQEKGQYDVENMAIFYLIRINVAYGCYSEVMALLKRIRLQAQTQNNLDCYTMLDITEGWLYALVGQTQKVAGWIKNEAKSLEEALPSVFSVHYFVRTKCYLSEQKYYELLAFLEQRDVDFGVEDFLVGAIEIKILKAIALYQIKEHASAITILQEAYNLAYPNFLIMPFIEYGTHMRTIINAAMNSKKCTIPKQWLENIYTKSSTYAKKLLNIVAEYKLSNGLENNLHGDLTKREIEVLSDLCHGLTREEIADNCNLSSNTVKSMLQSIYMKLGAVNSLDAVRIAMFMNLLK